MGRFYSINESTVCTTVKCKDAIKKTVQGASPRANMMKVGHDPYVAVMEKALFLWVEDCKELPCTMKVLMSRAHHIYSELLDKAEVQDRSKACIQHKLWLAGKVKAIL